ncbi:MAG TPA: LLM class F420-dependent oxidoreductase [Ktedonobacteraceae bacterium]|nr:LLM class F420-dependent oxidoreductase [Ktedonobacteraceae bacterium]
MEYGIIAPHGWRLDLRNFTDPVEAYEAMTRAAQDAEALGYNSIWLYDHLHTFPIVTQDMFFECWMTTAGLARDTKRLRIGQTVTCNSYRNPALLAKMASTVDVMSHGRLILGIGAGWYQEEYLAYGYPYPSAKERLQRLGEAVQLILAMWTQEQATVGGRYYHIEGAINQPKGVQKPHIPLLIGGGGEKMTLRLVAQYADACNVGGGDVSTIKHKLDVLRQHCQEIGRDYNSIWRTTLIDYCSIADTQEEALAKFTPEERADEGIMSGALIGTPDTIRPRLAALEEAGIQEVILRFVDAPTLDCLRLFAQSFVAKSQ